MAGQRIQHEAILQKQIVDYLRAVLHPAIVSAIPNASRRTVGGRAGNAVSGLTPGIPDLMVILPKGRIIFFELKSEKGRVSDVQLEIHIKLQSLNHECAVVRSIEDVKNSLLAWGIETREVK